MATARPIVLITGSDGRIGRAISAELGAAYHVVGMTRRCADRPDCISIDLASDEAVAATFDRFRKSYGDRVASVIHLAAYYDFTGEPSPLYDEVNVRGTQRLLQALASFDVGQFVYASTMLVHAPTAPGFPIDEDWQFQPKWAYPRSKLDAETVVHERRGNIRSVLLRIAGVYTDDCDLPSLAFQIQRIYERHMLSHVFPGDMSHGQALVHIDDVAAAFRLVVERRARLPEETAFLIGEPITESYQALQNLIGRLAHGEPWETRSIPKTVAAAGAWLQNKVEDVVPDSIDRGVEPFVKPFMIEFADDHYELDITRADTHLGWRPRNIVRSVLPRMIGKLWQDPVGWYRRNKIPLPVWLEEAPETGKPGARIVAEYHKQQRVEHRRTLWCHFANASLGLWLVASPFTFGIADNWMQAGELIAPNQRGVPLSDTYMTASDVASGLLIVILAFLSLGRDFGWARWTLAGLGCWLLLAPLVFWTTSAAAYANDTLVGLLVMLFAVAIPPPPGISPTALVTGPVVPPGWDYSPSGWTNRILIVGLALLGLIISRYLAAFQLGHIDRVWDPFFGEGTERIVTSWVSDAWPVSDAGLGGAAYAVEIAAGVIGDKRRWRTLPWLVLLFGILIIPLGAVSIFFIMIQPVWIGTWCTLCLVGAAATLIQIPYSFDEVLATLQFLKKRRQAGRPLLYTLFRGDTIAGGGADYADNFESSPRALLGEMLRLGVSVPWNLALSTAIGIALMFSRLLFGTSGDAADNDHVAGAMIVAVSVIAMGQVARPLRVANIALGAWLTASPLLFSGYSAIASVALAVAGLALIGLALPAGRITTHYGEWDRLIGRPFLRRGGRSDGVRPLRTPADDTTARTP